MKTFLKILFWYAVAQLSIGALFWGLLHWKFFDADVVSSSFYSAPFLAWLVAGPWLTLLSGEWINIPLILIGQACTIALIILVVILTLYFLFGIHTSFVIRFTYVDVPSKTGKILKLSFHREEDSTDLVPIVGINGLSMGVTSHHEDEKNIVLIRLQDKTKIIVDNKELFNAVDEGDEVTLFCKEKRSHHISNPDKTVHESTILYAVQVGDRKITVFDDFSTWGFESKYWDNQS